MRIVSALRAAVVPLALAAGVLVAGCGSSSPSSGSKPASSVIPAMEAAVDHATSVHMTGLVRDDGTRIGFDIRFHGSRLAGRMDEGGAAFEVIVLPGRSYLRVDSAFLSRLGVPATVCVTICGKYFLLPSSDAQSITGALGMTRLTRDLFGKIPKSARKSGVEFVPASYDGQPVLRVRKGGFTLDVAAAGTPYPLAILAPHGQYLKFSDWNNVGPPAGPAKSKVVTANQLAQLAHSDD
jgi:hypothetical protein